MAARRPLVRLSGRLRDLPVGDHIPGELIGALDWKESVRVATTANIALSGLQTVDGIALAATNRALVRAQTAPAENGLWDVVDGGPWTRSSDADTSAEVTSGLTTYVEEGATHGGKFFKLTTPDPITLGTTALTFEETQEVVSKGGFTFVTKAGEAYALVVSDVNKWIGFTGSNPVVTVPANATANIKVNSEIVVQKRGAANQLTIAAEAGVDLDAPYGLVLSVRYSWALLYKVAKNRWVVTLFEGPPLESLGIAASDESTALTIGGPKVTWHAPYAFTLSEIFIGLSTPSTSGVVTADVNKAGVSLFTTNPSVGANEQTSLSGVGSVQGVLGTTALAKGDKLTIDVDAAGTGAKGLKVYLIGRRAP